MIVGFGVRRDMFVVRFLLVPALGYDIGSRIGWPSKLVGTSARPKDAEHPLQAGLAVRS